MDPGSRELRSLGRDDEIGSTSKYYTYYPAYFTAASDSQFKMTGYVYILASKKDGTLYTGVTSDLSSRVWTHKQRLNDGFTSRYGAVRLVWYQEYVDIGEAIIAEKRIKKWPRAWKIEMIEKMNPDWKELYGGMGW